MDCFARTPEIRRSVILVTCDAASGLLQRPFVEPLPSQTLIGLSEYGTLSGKISYTTLNDFLLKLKEPGIEPITLHTAGRKTKDLQILYQGEDPKQENPAPIRSLPLESEEKIPGILPEDSPYLDPLKETGTGKEIEAMTVLLGIAAYRDDKLVGTLNGNDARGYFWVSGKVQSGILETLEVKGQECNVAALIIKSSSKIKPVLGEGLPKIKIEVNVVLSIFEHQDVELNQVPHTLEELENRFSEIVKSEITQTLTIVQKEFKADIYGFGQAIYRNHPKTWDLYAQSWNEEFFPNLEVEIEVDAQIMTSGIIQNPY